MENHSFPIVRPCIIISVIPENMWYVFWLIRRLELMCRFIAEPIMKECSDVWYPGTVSGNSLRYKCGKKFFEQWVLRKLISNGPVRGFPET